MTPRITQAAAQLFSVAKVRYAILLFLLVVCSIQSTFAHKLSDSYLMLRRDGTTLHGQWDIALRDLELAIGLDENQDGSITWAELRHCRPALERYAAERLKLFSSGKPESLRWQSLRVDRHSDGAYAVLLFDARLSNNQSEIGVEYTALFEIDPQHRGLLTLDCAGQSRQAVFSPARPRLEFPLTPPPKFFQWLTFLREGIWHIWLGFDHILFLIALLLPAVLERKGDSWNGIDGLSAALANVLKTVTAFTIAHSVTLSLAALDILRLPVGFIEPAIAASIVFTGLNNLFQITTWHPWRLAFLFGLVHGFGFANVLSDLGLERGALAQALFGFNAGVEVGQIVLVLGFVPLTFAWRAHASYCRFAFPYGSGTIVLVAMVWLAERILDFKWLPF